MEWSKKLNNRPKQIRQMKNALQILEAEIVYSQLPLQDVFFKIARQIPAPLNAFFENLNQVMQQDHIELYDVWEEKVDELKTFSSFDTNELEILKQFGRTLGQHDFYQQQKQIQLALTHLERELEDAKENQHRYGRMAKSTGLLCGLFIVILLI